MLGMGETDSQVLQALKGQYINFFLIIFIVDELLFIKNIHLFYLLLSLSLIMYRSSKLWC